VTMVALVRAGSACHREPLVLAGSGHGRRTRTAAQTAFAAPASDGQAAAGRVRTRGIAGAELMLFGDRAHPPIYRT
jgi:hypothetical protein